MLVLSTYYFLGSLPGIIAFVLIPVWYYIYAKKPELLLYGYISLMFLADSFVGDFLIMTINTRNFQSVAVGIGNSLAYTYLLISLLKGSINKINNNPIVQFLIVYLVWLAINTMFSSYMDNSLKELTVRVPQFIALFILMAVTITSTDKIDELLKVFLFIIGVLVFLGLFKLAIGDWESIALGDLRLFVPIVIGYSFYYKERNPKQYRKYMILAILSSLLSLLTMSRRVLIAIVLYWGFAFSRSRNSMPQIIAIVGIAIASWTFSPPEFKERIILTIEVGSKLVDEEEQTTDGQMNALMTGRQNIWEIGFDMFKEKPIFGQGYKSTNSYTKENIGHPYKMHNMYLKFLAELGLIGLVLLLYYIFMVYNVNLKTIKQLKILKLDYYSVMLQALNDSFIVLMITGFFGYHSLYDKIDWLNLGIFYAFSNICVSLIIKRLNEDPETSVPVIRGMKNAR